MNYHKEYKKIMKSIPDSYKLRDYKPKSITELQILALLKLFIQKDTRLEGWIFVWEMIQILKALKFFTSNKELEYLVWREISDSDLKFDKVKDEKITFSIFISVVDTLKREKLVLVKLLYYLNYIIFGLFLLIISIYITNFYSYKYNS